MSVSMCPVLSVDVHKPYTLSEFFTHMDFVMKPYNVFIKVSYYWQTPLCSKCLVGFYLCS